MKEKEAKRTKVFKHWQSNFEEHVCLPQPGTGKWRTWDCGQPGTGLLAFTVLIGPRAIILTGDLGNLMLHPNTKSAQETLWWLKGRFGLKGEVAEDYLIEKAQPQVALELDKSLVDKWLGSSEFVNSTYKGTGTMMAPNHLEELAESFRRVDSVPEFVDLWWRSFDQEDGDYADVLDVPHKVLIQIECLRWFAENEGKVGKKRYAIAWTEQHCAIVRSHNEDDIRLQVQTGDIDNLVKENGTKREETFETVIEVVDITELPDDG